MFAFVAALLASTAPVVRTSEVELTPPEPLPLGGYTARGENVMQPGDRLFARTVVFEATGTRVALVSFEALTVPESLVDAVKARIPKDVGLFLAATHTHCAPDSQMLNERMNFKIPGIAPFNRRWLEWYADKIADGIKTALDAHPVPFGALSWRQADVEANRNRRGGKAPIKTATWLAGESMPLLTVYSAHATVFDEKRLATSGDWPGAFSSQVGGAVFAGAIGDASPAVDGNDPVENVAFMVEKLRAGFSRAQVIEKLAGERQVRFAQAEVALDKVVPSKAFAEHFSVGPPLDQVLVGKFAPPRAVVTLVQIGSMLLVGVPGEPTGDVARGIEEIGRSAGFPHTVTISHCNGWIGYVLMPEDYDKGGYEAALSFNGRDTSKRILGAVEAGIRSLVQPPRVAQVR